MTKNTLGLRIRHFRERKRLSLSEAARQIGCSKGHLWELEADIQDNPGLKILVAMCGVFGISLRTLLRGLVP
jgi:transcriptional regulator with XRE-family HTH domain